jgi:hypothetical protein
MAASFPAVTSSVAGGGGVLASTGVVSLAGGEQRPWAPLGAQDPLP